MKDTRHVYHAVMDNGMYHAWSEDGARWTLTPRMTYTGFDSLPCTGFAGRPHLVFGKDGVTPIAMTGACYNHSKVVPFGGATFTALIPIDP